MPDLRLNNQNCCQKQQNGKVEKNNDNINKFAHSNPCTKVGALLFDVHTDKFHSKTFAICY